MGAAEKAGGEVREMWFASMMSLENGESGGFFLAYLGMHMWSFTAAGDLVQNSFLKIGGFYDDVL